MLLLTLYSMEATIVSHIELYEVGTSPAQPLLAVPNVIVHPSTASVPITVLLYNGPLLCSLNMPIKG